jgi:hypothetical protein
MKLRCLVWGKILTTWRPRHQGGVRVREEMLAGLSDHCVYTAVESVASAECRPRGRAGRDVHDPIQLIKCLDLR